MNWSDFDDLDLIVRVIGRLELSNLSNNAFKLQIGGKGGEGRGGIGDIGSLNTLFLL